MTLNISKIKKTLETYRLIRKLSKINGLNISAAMLDRIVYNAEALPHLGKEYWWFLFFGLEEEKPIQLMLLIFRKHGKKMLFNGKEMALRELGENQFQGISTGWLYDGKTLRELGDTSSITEIQEKKIVSEISGKELTLSGGFPNYKLKIGDIVDLDIKKANYLIEKDGQGGLIFPFGIGWVNIFLKAEGLLMGRQFKGTAHLQKVVGVIPPGSFNWGRIFFQNGSTLRFFCVKTGRDSKIYFCKSLTFCDQKNKKIIKLTNPEMKISKNDSQWIVEGKEKDKDFRIVFESYAKKQFNMRGGGSQIYIEYLILPKEFYLKTEERTVTLDNLGKGVGTFEDAYW